MDKKTQILNAAIEVFAKQGLERGKIADIAKEAGIGKGTVYEYFKSKDEIFNAIEQMFVFDSIDQLNNMIEKKSTATDKLDELINYSLNMHEALGDAALIIAELWAQHGRGQLHGHKASAFAETYDNFYELVINVLSDGVKSGEFKDINKEGITALILAFIDGIIWQSVIFKNNKQFGKKKKQAIKALLSGIKL